MATKINNALLGVADYLKPSDYSNIPKAITHSSGTTSGYTNPSYSTNLVVGQSGSDYGAASADPTGKYAFNPVTGLNKQGLTRGQQSAADYQTNTGLVDTVKNPAIQNQIQQTGQQVQDQQKNLIKSFDDYLAEAKTLQTQGKDAVAEDVATFQNAPKQLANELSSQVKDFASATGAIGDEYRTAQDANKAQMDKNIAQLGQENLAYEDAARNLAARNNDYGQAAANARFSAGGTPVSGSGYQDQVRAKVFNDTMLPVEREISANRINQLTNFITPLQRQNFTDTIQRLTGFELPVAQTLAQMGITNASQVAQFTASLAGRGLNEQLQLLASMGLPIQLAQSIITSLPQALQQLQSLDANNNFYTLTQGYQNPIPAQPTYNPGVPNVQPNNNRPIYLPNNGGGDYPMVPGVSSAPGKLPNTVNPRTGLPVPDYSLPFPSRLTNGMIPGLGSMFNLPPYQAPAPLNWWDPANERADAGITSGGEFFPAVTQNDYMTM